MTFRNNILFEPLNQEEATVYNSCSCLRRNIHLWSTLPSMGRKSSSTAEDPLIETVLHDCEGGEGEAGERGEMRGFPLS